MLTFLIFILVILVLVFLIGPKLIDTITNIVNTVPESVESLRKLLQDTNINWDWVQDYLASIEIDWQSISNKVLSFFKDSFSSLFTSTFGVVIRRSFNNYKYNNKLYICSLHTYFKRKIKRSIKKITICIFT